MKKLAVVIIFAEILLSVIVIIWLFIWVNRYENDIIGDMDADEYEDLDTIVPSGQLVEISSEEEWIDFAVNVNSGESYAGCNISLNTDLDFGTYDSLAPIGNEVTPFAGNFYGNNHTIKGIRICSGERFVGVFGYTQGASIRDLNISECEICSYDAIGTGGIIGRANSGIIRSCTVQGIVDAERGSAGGVVGNNWAYIFECTFYGSVRTNQNSATIYSLKGYGSIRCGVGGISGDNNATIKNCVNYAEIGNPFKDASARTAGGIVGNNYCTIDTCANFGNVCGGGIASSNQEWAAITRCINLGVANAGISKNGYTNSIVDYCVNIGEVSGRYSGDIISYWGSSNKENLAGRISRCLYTGASGHGAVCSNNSDKDTAYSNHRIVMPKAEVMNHLISCVQERDFIGAFNSVAQAENSRRHLIRDIVTIVLVTGFILINATWLFWINISRHIRYRQAEVLKEAGAYSGAYNGFLAILNYKDGFAQARLCLIESLQQYGVGTSLQFGIFDGTPISWKVIDVTTEGYLVLSEYALLVDCIDSSNVAVSWETSEMYKKLNGSCKNAWFNSVEQSVLGQEISIMTMDHVRQILPLCEQRQCQALRCSNDVLSCDGKVYWWICKERSVPVYKMPFISSDGVISETGKIVTANNIAVRPVLEIRIKK